MSEIFNEGFEGMGTAADSSATIQALLEKRYPGGVLTNGNGVQLVAAEAADGSFALRWGTTTSGESNSLFVPLGDQSGKTLIVGMRIKLSSSVVSDYAVMTLRGVITTTITDQLSVQIQNNADIRLVRGFTEIGISAGVLTAGSDHYIELEAEVGNSATAKVYVDGVLEINFTGDTQNGSTNAVDELEINGVESESAGDFGSTDDIYCFNTDGSLNNARLGPSANVRYYTAASDGMPTNWTPSSAVDHYTLVDENPESSSDYVESSTAGQIELFGMETVTADDIASVTLEMIGIAATVGAPAIRGKAVRTSTTNGARQTFTDTTDEVVLRETFPTDPFTGVAWLDTGVNAAEFGIERIA